MPLRSMKTPKQPLLDADLDALESRIGTKLPPEYRAWLLTYNGGHPVPANFNFKAERGPYTDSSIAWFYAVYDGKFENFERQYLAFCVRSRRYPDHLVGIARDPGGNEILLAFSGPNEGKVYFWDHEAETVPPSYKNCHLIADSFDEFIESLHD